MGTNVVTTSRKFLYELKNGSAFGSNLTDFTPNLVGSPIEKVKMITTVRVDWNSGAINGETFDFPTNGQCTRYTGNFLNDGWAIGDTFDYLDAFTGTILLVGEITAISNDGLNIYYTKTSGSEQTGNLGVTGSYFRGTTVLKSLLYNFGLIENLEATNYISKATGQEQGYTFKDLTASTTGATINGISNWETGSITCSTGVISGTYYQTFTITHYFTIPYYAIGYEADYLANTIPAEYSGTSSLKYVSRCEFRAVFSNPNGSKIGIDDKNNGSVAWFNENFNGIGSGYAISSVSYTDDATLATVAGIQASGKTRVEIVVTGAFTATHKFGIYISKGNAQSLLNLSTSYTNLWLVEDVIGTVDDAPASGTIITAYECAKDAGNTFCTIRFNVEYSSPQAATIADGEYFLIGIQLAQGALATNVSDKVTMMVFPDVYGLYIVDVDVPGLLEWLDNRYYNHTQVCPDDTIDLSDSQHDYKGWIEDGVTNSFLFKLDLDKDAILDALKAEFICYNTTTGEYWVIDTYQWNLILGAIALVTGTTKTAFQINSQPTRGYNLPAGDQFNVVKITSDTVLYDNWIHYNCMVPWKINWQDWIKNSNVASYFYDASKLFNGFNQKVDRFITGDYRLKFLYTATVLVRDSLGVVSSSTDYKLLSPNIVIKNYNVDGFTPPKWSAATSTYTEDGATNLSGKILSNANTKFKIIWTFNTATYGPMGGLFDEFISIHRIEPSMIMQSSIAIEELSSVRDSLKYLLKPVSGQTLLKVTVGSDTVTTECNIDYRKLDQGTNYKLSGRLFGLDALLGLTWEEINVEWEYINDEWQVI